MKIQFTSKELLPPLRLAFAGAATKDIQPVLTGVKITATKENDLLLQAATKDTGIRIAANAHVAKEGTTAVPRAMLKVLESAPKTEMLTLETTKKGMVLSGKGIARTEMPTFDDDEFPDIEEFTSKDDYLHLPAEDMLSLIRRTIIAVSKGDTHPERTSICFELVGWELTAVATDGHLLVWQTVRCKSVNMSTIFGLESTLHKNRVLVCTPAAKLLTKILKDKTIGISASKEFAPQIKIAKRDKDTVEFQYGNVTLFVRAPSSQFPAWREVIPKMETSLCADLPCKDVLDAVKAVKPVTDRGSPNVCLTFAFDRLNLSATRGDRTEASKSLQIKGNGSGYVNLKHKHLLDVFSVFDGSVKWQMDGEHFVQISPSESSGVLLFPQRSGEYRSLTGNDYVAIVDGVNLGEAIRQKNKEEQEHQNKESDNDDTE